MYEKVKGGMRSSLKILGKNLFFNLLEKAQILEQSSFFSQNVKKLNLFSSIQRILCIRL